MSERGTCNNRRTYDSIDEFAESPERFQKLDYPSQVEIDRCIRMSHYPESGWKTGRESLKSDLVWL